MSNILYNTPTPMDGPPTRHILNCLVQNEPGVLSRLSGILAARGFNIESLVVANTEVPDLSRMTMVFNGRDTQIEQARRQLEDMVRKASRETSYSSHHFPSHHFRSLYGRSWTIHLQSWWSVNYSWSRYQFWVLSICMNRCLLPSLIKVWILLMQTSPIPHPHQKR